MPSDIKMNTVSTGCLRLPRAAVSVTACDLRIFKESAKPAVSQNALLHLATAHGLQDASSSLCVDITSTPKSLGLDQGLQLGNLLSAEFALWLVTHSSGDLIPLPDLILIACDELLCSRSSGMGRASKLNPKTVLLAHGQQLAVASVLQGVLPSRCSARRQSVQDTALWLHEWLESQPGRHLELRCAEAA